MPIPDQAQIVILRSNSRLWEAAQAILGLATFFGERLLCVSLDEPNEEWLDLLERLTRSAFRAASSYNLLLDPEELEEAPTEGQLELICYPQQLVVLRRLPGFDEAYSEEGPLIVSPGPAYPALKILRWLQGDESIAKALEEAAGSDLNEILESKTTPGNI
jgi:hypothetical protein